jgi:hypothetical protein
MGNENGGKYTVYVYISRKNYGDAIDYAVDTAVSALSIAKTNTKKIDKHEKSINCIHQKLIQLTRENDSLKDKLIQQDSIGRRDNIIIRGVAEKEGGKLS